MLNWGVREKSRFWFRVMRSPDYEGWSQDELERAYSYLVMTFGFAAGVLINWLWKAWEYHQ